MKLPAFYPIIDTQFCRKAGVAPVKLARALAEAGAQIAQFRHKGPYTREIFEQAEEIGRILKEKGSRYLIDDRPDIALMLQADGVHIGQDDLPPEAVRTLVGRSMTIGFSTHNEQQLRDGGRQPVDYLAIGPIFGTQSKENPDPLVGTDQLSRLRSLTEKPLAAIGGLTRANAQQTLEAGADSLAVISDVAVGDIAACISEWLRCTA